MRPLRLPTAKSVPEALARTVAVAQLLTHQLIYNGRHANKPGNARYMAPYLTHGWAGGTNSSIKKPAIDRGQQQMIPSDRVRYLSESHPTNIDRAQATT